MNQLEVSKLLTIASVVDNRIVGRETVEVWQKVIGHLDFDVSVEALELFRRESDKYLQPANIVTNVKRINEDRIAHMKAVEPDQPHYPYPANLEAWSAAHASPVEFARQEAIYHQQCRDEGFDPHEAVNGYPYKCRSCAS